jgi:hypothetical protein
LVKTDPDLPLVEKVCAWITVVALLCMVVMSAIGAEKPPQMYVMQSRLYSVIDGTPLGQARLVSDEALTEADCNKILWDSGPVLAQDGSYIIFSCLPIERIGESST